MSEPTSQESNLLCENCGAAERLLLVAADLGQGAFLAVLCETCWHRRQYKAELESRKGKR